eukprot:TRINITY_DN1606_c0_g1_i3.p1 TRINITY_DN1606_c0_g1~~TRINITY_DN1606_c0_g1_i3.p1  ORF type:complete len:418 (+),score=57.59 TRINITY_DN1606_c0_g1_i3:239-1492(+)
MGNFFNKFCLFPGPEERRKVWVPDNTSTDPNISHSSGSLASGSTLSEMSSQQSTSTPSLSINHSATSASSTDHQREVFVRSRSAFGNLTQFTLREMEAATGRFSDKYLLGEGGFGKVYKGFISRSRITGGPKVAGEPTVAVAVKKLVALENRRDQSRGDQEWLREIQFLGNLAHENLVYLIGYCAERADRLLVYEFVSRGSLDDHLDFDPQVPCLSWQNRIKIAVHAARGLEHLHSQNIIHRDIKAANILIDQNYCAKLTDFGIAKDADLGIGSQGYLDPCCRDTCQLTKESDVYSFGVVLLQLVCGKRAILTPETEQVAFYLTEWAYPYLATLEQRPEGEAYNCAQAALLDEKLADNPFPSRVAMTLLTAAQKCFDTEILKRPTVTQLLEVLEPLLAVIEESRIEAEVSTSIDEEK